MTKLSLSEISYQDGLKLLYLRKQALDNNQLPRLTKQAMADSDLFLNTSANFEKKALSLQEVIGKLRDVVKNNENLSSLKDKLKQNYEALPEEAKRGLIGAGIGGGAGSLASTLFGNKSRNAFNRALLGGVGGAALGGGIGLASVGAQELADKSKESKTAPDNISAEAKKRQEELVKTLESTDMPTAVKERALSTALNVPDTGTVFSPKDLGTIPAMSYTIPEIPIPTPWGSDNPTLTTPEIPLSISEKRLITPTITNNSLKATAGGSAAGAVAAPVLSKVLSKFETNKSPEAIQAAVKANLLNKLKDNPSDYAGESVQRQLQDLENTTRRWFTKNRSRDFDATGWNNARALGPDMSKKIDPLLTTRLTKGNLKKPKVQEWVQSNVAADFNMKRPTWSSRYLSGRKGVARGGLLGGLAGLGTQLYLDNTARHDADQALIEALSYPNK